MAVRPQHGHDGGIAERRLRPIFDWLDNGNNKKALQEAEKVLKKSSTLQAARALKALALLRLGKGTEAHSVLDALAEENPTDDTTLQAMTISYRESHQLHKLCALYEAAVKAEPGKEEHHSHLFMSYVRVGDYKSQQRTAMALYKFAPKNPYYFWAVMSIVLQAKSSDDTTKKGILLSLAQRMVDNFISENKMEAEQEARLYIMILELQEKWEEILKFMEGPIYAKLLPGSMPQASIPYLRHLRQWSKLNLLCKDLLYENQDRWDFYVPYFDSVFQLTKSPDGDVHTDDTPEKCHEFICQMVESMGPSRTLRGPYLARLELWKRLSEGGDAVTLLGSSVALCVQYLRLFAHKPCALPDLRPYLQMIPQKEREQRCGDFLTCLDLDVNSEPESIENVQRHVNCIGAWSICAPPAEPEADLALAGVLRRQYLRALQGGLAVSTLTEFGPADQYAIIAAHYYFNAAMKLQKSEPILEALTLLEMVLHHSPANFHAKLLLVKFYHLLGNALAADGVYQRLELKHVQLVSLGWVHAARLPAACAPRRALALLADTHAFHTHHAKDSVEHLTYAYKYGTFEKLSELAAWAERLERCAWCALVARERALLALLAAPPAPLHAPPTPPHAHTDNRDLNVILNWAPAHPVDPSLQARTMTQEVSYLALKDGLVSSMALCIELADRQTDGKRKRYEDLKMSADALGTTMDKCKEVYCEREKISISAPFPSRIIAFVNSPVPYRELYASLFNLVAELALGRAAEAHSLADRAALLLRRSRDELTAAVNDLLRREDPLWRTREALEDISNYLELIGILIFILGVCNELVTPAHGKKSKKKGSNQSPDELKTLELLNRLNESTQSSLVSLEEMFDRWPEPSSDGLVETFEKLVLEDYYCPVEQKLKSGHAKMVSDIKDIIKKKMKYLKSIIQ